MRPAASADWYLVGAYWAGVAALALTLLISLQIVLMRIASRRRAQREAVITARWRPILNAALAGVAPETMPRLRPRDALLFLKLWLHLHLSVRGEAGEHLNDVALRLQCDVMARMMLRSRRRAERLMAIMTLGHLRHRAAWDELLAWARSPDRAASIYALWALVQIDAGEAARELAPLLLKREDWALSQLANILSDAREQWEPALAAAIRNEAPERLPNILRLLDALRLSLPVELLRELLRARVPEVVTAALRIVATPELAPEVRAHLEDEEWRIRLQAVRALGQIGGRADVPLLVARLGDREWWVRYRAAQAVVNMPFVTRQELAELSGPGADRYASDMLRQVMAEQEAAR